MGNSQCDDFHTCVYHSSGDFETSFSPFGFGCGVEHIPNTRAHFGHVVPRTVENVAQQVNWLQSLVLSSMLGSIKLVSGLHFW